MPWSPTCQIEVWKLVPCALQSYISGVESLKYSYARQRNDLDKTGWEWYTDRVHIRGGEGFWSCIVAETTTVDINQGSFGGSGIHLKVFGVAWVLCLLLGG